MRLALHLKRNGMLGKRGAGESGRREDKAMWKELWQGARGQQQQGQGQPERGECQLGRLTAQEPQYRVQAEAGVTEFWDYNDDQFQCANVAVCRTIIQPRGLLLPSYTNAPKLFYVIQGRGMTGVMCSGCPETYQSSQQSERYREGGQSQRFRDQHQKVRNFRKGDIIALPAGVAHWCYNDGDEELVILAMEDTGNNQNQLDNNPRKFFLAGNPQQQGQQQGQQQRPGQQQQPQRPGQQEQQQRPQYRGEYGSRRGQEQHNAGNVFSGFDSEVLAESFGVDRETARRLQGQDDQRGHIVRVERGLLVLRPSSSQEEQEEQERGGRYQAANGLEETVCSARLIENINDPSRADIYNPRAGRLTSVNGHNLPILNYLRLSAERGVLYRNALMAPHWKINAHSILYATRGEARVQVVDQRGQAVFDGRVREGELLVVPQNYVVAKQAGDEGFEFVAFKTHENAMCNTLAGRTSAIRAIPVDVLANAYGMSRDEARRLKTNRNEAILLEPRSGLQRRA
ncbi:hypothetical protein RHMOL_Rhmol13G0043900 [Rhododendron molle]|uniref:Uncharacterized protein n=1 Tax=Rhododendron molle TaxID=49168 RepID=A0ACC0L2T9_RHOML|nr:hypothetical protein RHMOL_Rhmol13G0043900 [Rhododendron molle]